MASHNTSPKKLNELSKPLREEAQFFLEPATPRQRQYEALRAYFVEQLPVKEVATRFGYTPGAFYHEFILKTGLSGEKREAWASPEASV